MTVAWFWVEEGHSQGEETEDTTQLLNCRGKKVTNGGRKSIFISDYKEIIT